MYVSQNKIFSVLNNGVMSSFQHHVRKILMYINNSLLVETKKGNDNCRHSLLHLSIYDSIASYNRWSLKKENWYSYKYIHA